MEVLTINFMLLLMATVDKAKAAINLDIHVTLIFHNGQDQMDWESSFLKRRFCLHLGMIISRRERNKRRHSLEGNKNRLSFAWINDKRSATQNASSNKDHIEKLLDDNSFDILGISESNVFKKDDLKLLKIKNYNLINDKLLNSWGRARSSVYISDKIRYKVRLDLMTDEFPEVWLQIEERGKGQRPLLYCQVYREQSEVRGSRSREQSDSSGQQRERLIRWIEKTQQVFEKENKDCVIGGDLNADLRESDGDPLGKLLREGIVEELGLDMHVTGVTHQEVRRGITCRGRIIDHIYSNLGHRLEDVKVLDVLGSNHKMVTATLLKKVNYKTPPQVLVRVRKEYSKEKLLHLLDTADWSLPDTTSSNKEEKAIKLEEAVEKITKNFKEVLDKIAPMKMVNNKHKKDDWKKDEDLQNQWKKERELWDDFSKDKTNLLKKHKWESCNKETKRLIQSKKSQYLDNKIVSSCNESKALWRTMKEILNWTEEGPPTELRNEKGKVETNMEKVAEIFHSRLEDKVNTIASDMEEFCEEKEEEEHELDRIFKSVRPVSERFKFKEVELETVEKIMNELERKTSCGDDGVSYLDLVDGSFYSVPFIHFISNMIIQTNHWPRTWKNSIIKPLYKGSDDKWDAASYRPVALTPAISRIVEKILNKQMLDFLEEEDLIPQQCHGFVGGRGCATAVADILEKMVEGIERGKISTLLGIDISSAFDCLPRSKLIRQMRRMSFGGEALELIESYFKGRTQQVMVGGRMSGRRPSFLGVLQGSGLSPTLFLIFFIRGVMAAGSPHWDGGDCGDDEGDEELPRPLAQPGPGGCGGGSLREANEPAQPSHLSLVSECREVGESGVARQLQAPATGSRGHAGQTARGVDQDRHHTQHRGGGRDRAGAPHSPAQSQDSSVCYADDLNAILFHKGGSRRGEVEEKVKVKGEEIENTLRKLGLCMNKKKTQFLHGMNYQRRKPSCKSPIFINQFEEKMTVEVGGMPVEEKDTVKTLGVIFENDLNFKQHWQETRIAAWKKLFGLWQIFSHISFKNRKILGNSLVVSKLTYCLESTSCCTKTVLQGAKKPYNRLVRMVCNEWAWERTHESYRSCGWLELHELAIYKTLVMARKLLHGGKIKEILKMFARRNQAGVWEVLEPTQSRTQMKRRTFSSRVRRLWKTLNEYDKSCELNKPSNLKYLKQKIASLSSQTKEWILWGEVSGPSEEDTGNDSGHGGEDKEGDQGQNQPGDEHEGENGDVDTLEDVSSSQFGLNSLLPLLLVMQIEEESERRELGSVEDEKVNTALESAVALVMMEADQRHTMCAQVNGEHSLGERIRDSGDTGLGFDCAEGDTGVEDEENYGQADEGQNGKKQGKEAADEGMHSDYCGMRGVVLDITNGGPYMKTSYWAEILAWIRFLIM